MAIQAQQRITFQRLAEGKSSYTHIRYSEDGATFTAPSQEATKELADYAHNLLPQTETGWSAAAWASSNGSYVRTNAWISVTAHVPVMAGRKYILRTSGRLANIVSFNADKRFLRNLGRLKDGAMVVFNEGELFAGVSLEGTLAGFRDTAKPLQPALYEIIPTDGRNLVLRADTEVVNSQYDICRYDLSHSPIVGETLTVTIWGALGEERTQFGVFNSGANGNMACFLAKVGEGVYQGTFRPWRAQYGTDQVPSNQLWIYAYPPTATSPSRIDRIKLEYGEIGTPFSLAPEDALQGTTAGRYVGIMTSDSPVASPRFEDYKWQLIKGDKGDKGDKGEDGEKGEDGVDGEDGQDGRGVSSMQDYFLASPRSEGITATTAGFVTTLPATSAESPYLWSYTLITYTDGTSQKTPARIVSIYNAGINPNLWPISAITPAPNATEDGDKAWNMRADGSMQSLTIAFNGLLEGNAWYTISFRARTKNLAGSTNGQCRSQLMGTTVMSGSKTYVDGVEKSPVSTGLAIYNGLSAWSLDTHTFTFRTPATVAQSASFKLMIYSGYECHFSQFKLERGMQATGYIPHKDDLRGQDGAISPMLYPAGFWSAETAYTKDDTAVPYVIYPNTGDGKPYILTAPSSQGNPPTDMAYWKPMNALQETFIKALVADFGQIGSAVFTGHKLISQMGVDAVGNESADFKAYPANFTPNIELDFRTGEVRMRKANISGNVNGVSGTFKELQCINNAGEVVGSISFGANGTMTFDGDIYSQGHKNGRALRYYASDIYCRGQFGACSRNAMIVRGDHAMYCLNGLGSAQGQVRINFTKKTTALGVVYYDLNLYGDTSGAYGYPVDLVIFNTPTPFNYRLLADVGKTVKVFNANDRQHVTIFASGRQETISGGVSAGFINVGANNMYPVQDQSIIGAGWVMEASRDTNW